MLTFAFCTFKRADRLPTLLAAMRAQVSPEPFEILAVNNNSPDATLDVLAALAREPGAPLRYVTETEQGIVPARNRAIRESLDSDIMVFIDDDEIPRPGLLETASRAIRAEGAQCVGGRVEMDFSRLPRPRWLGDELLGFLAAIDYGPEPFWITDTSTPVWTANVAYDMRLFREDPTLRFDIRYNREGNVVGGGSDAIMFRALLARNTRLRYDPGMTVLHDVEDWRLRRSYFLKLHYRGGRRYGRYQLPDYPRLLFGVPPFMFKQGLQQALKTAWMYGTGAEGALRQAMNVAHTLGCMQGYRERGRA